MHQLALGRTTHRRIAGLPGDPIQVEAEQGRLQAQACRGEGCLAAGMAAAHHDQFKAFGGPGGAGHPITVHAINLWAGWLWVDKPGSGPGRACSSAGSASSDIQK